MGVLSITVPFQGERELRAALALLTVVNMLQMRWYKLPALYRSGVRYQREQKKTCWHPVNGGCEDWLSAAQVYAQRKGDCEDLASWRAAELRMTGERASAVPMKTSAGWHIVVLRADGSIEDPSRKLGMGRKRNR